MKKGFTLIELLIVVAIVGILAVFLVNVFSSARNKATFSRLKAEFRSFGTAMEIYLLDNEEYPPDVARNIPPGLEEYLAGGGWPAGPYSGSVYDWDNIAGADPYIQLSLRFCEIDGSNCNFPNEDWATSFDDKSSVYHCFEGDCRSHPGRPISHPGYCINCNE